MYKQRNTVERCVNPLKQGRGIATRYEKTSRRPRWASPTHGEARLPCHAMPDAAMARRQGTDDAVSGRWW